MALSSDDLGAMRARCEPYQRLEYPWDSLYDDEEQMLCRDLPACLDEIERLRAVCAMVVDITGGNPRWVDYGRQHLLNIVRNVAYYGMDTRAVEMSVGDPETEALIRERFNVPRTPVPSWPAERAEGNPSQSL